MLSLTTVYVLSFLFLVSLSTNRYIYHRGRASRPRYSSTWPFNGRGLWRILWLLSTDYFLSHDDSISYLARYYRATRVSIRVVRGFPRHGRSLLRGRGSMLAVLAGFYHVSLIGRIGIWMLEFCRSWIGFCPGSRSVSPRCTRHLHFV